MFADYLNVAENFVFPQRVAEFDRKTVHQPILLLWANDSMVDGSTVESPHRFLT
jgi:hypothetical protein